MFNVMRKCDSIEQRYNIPLREVIAWLSVRDLQDVNDMIKEEFNIKEDLFEYSWSKPNQQVIEKIRNKIALKDLQEI